MNRRSFVELLAASASSVPRYGASQEPSSSKSQPILLRPGQSRGADGRSVDAEGFKFQLRTPDLGGRLCIMVTDQPPLTGPPLHSHRDVDEWFFVTRGECVVEVGGDLYRLVEGASLMAPRKIPHRYLNGAVPGSMIIAFTPGGRMEEFFEEITMQRQSRPGRPLTNEEAAKFYARYNMDFLGGRLTREEFNKAKT